MVIALDPAAALTAGDGERHPRPRRRLQRARSRGAADAMRLADDGVLGDAEPPRDLADREPLGPEPAQLSDAIGGPVGGDHAALATVLGSAAPRPRSSP